MHDLHKPDRPAPVARWFHVMLGAIGLVLAFSFAETGIGAELLVLGSIAYVGWTARRSAGLLLALVAGIVDPVHRAALDAPVHLTPWLLAYFAMALVSSAIEAATRPT